MKSLVSTERDLTTHERAAMLALFRVPGLGPRTLRRLVDRFGSAAELVRELRRSVPATVAAAGRAGRWRPGTLDALRSLDLASAVGALDRYEARGLDIRVYGGERYPPGLADLADPPPLLFTEGPVPLDLDRSVAIVGTRAASHIGRARARELAGELARWGWTVVSGMARGIDASAHEGALDAGGRSVGVLGAGHDRPYPVENRGLFERMRVDGLLVSEFEPETPPARMSFPRRNRIIAALSRAVIVAEAGRPSGALITADHALDIGREVLAVPYRIDDPGGPGCLHLLRQGAGVAAGARDVFDAVGWIHDRPEPATPTASPPRIPSRVVDVLAAEPLAADEVAARLGCPLPDIVAELVRLELEGVVGRGPEGRFRFRPPPA